MTLLNLVLALPLAGFLIVLLMPREKPALRKSLPRLSRMKRIRRSRSMSM